MDDAVSSADDDVGTATTLQQDADRARREADQRLRALEIAAADARIATCVASEQTADEVAKGAALTATAWIRVPDVLRQGALQGECGALRSQLDEAAAPIRQRRDSALRAPARPPRRQSRRSAPRSPSRRERLSDLEETETRARKDHVAFTSVRDSALSEAKLHDETVTTAETALEAARAAGLIGVTETPAQGAHRLAAEVADAGAGRRMARQARLDAGQALKVAEASLEEKREVQRTADSAADAAESRAESAKSERLALTNHPLALDLGRGEVDLELVGAELANRAMEAATAHLSAAVRAEAQAEDDRRAATSLEADRLLPARREVEELCARLHASHITSAVPGWRYLAQAVSQKHHDAVIATYPALVDGIAVADADLDAAKELRLTPVLPALSSSDLDRSSTILPRVFPHETWVVPPAPAMFDPAAADEALELVLDRLVSVDERVKAHTTSERTARAFADALSVHIELWPPGTLEAATDLAAPEERRRTRPSRRSGTPARRAPPPLTRRPTPKNKSPQPKDASRVLSANLTQQSAWPMTLSPRMRPPKRPQTFVAGQNSQTLTRSPPSGSVRNRQNRSGPRKSPTARTSRPRPASILSCASCPTPAKLTATPVASRPKLQSPSSVPVSNLPTACWWRRRLPQKSPGHSLGKSRPSPT